MTDTDPPESLPDREITTLLKAVYASCAFLSIPARASAWQDLGGITIDLTFVPPPVAKHIRIDATIT